MEAENVPSKNSSRRPRAASPAAALSPAATLLAGRAGRRPDRRGRHVRGHFALGFAVDDPGESVAVLFTLPIVLAAIKFGAWGGIGAAAVAMGLLGLWDAAGQDQMPLLSYLGRAVA